MTVTDFMPFTEDEQKIDVVRIVRGVRGRVAMAMDLTLRFNYGQTTPWVRRRDYGLHAVAGPDAVDLHTRVDLEGRDMKTLARFTVAKGETVPFTLSYHPSHKTPHFVTDRTESQERTVAWWREWSSRCHFPSDNAPWREAVVRSLITLKLLIYEPTGGIVAAPTTSLPEQIGGGAQLGLPLLLAAGLGPDPLRPAQRRLSRRGRVLAPMAAARRRRPARPAGGALWRGRRTLAAREPSSTGCRAMRAASRSGWATRPPSSCSWTSMAS